MPSYSAVCGGGGGGGGATRCLTINGAASLPHTPQPGAST